MGSDISRFIRVASLRLSLSDITSDTWSEPTALIGGFSTRLIMSLMVRLWPAFQASSSSAEMNVTSSLSPSE